MAEPNETVENWSWFTCTKISVVAYVLLSLVVYILSTLKIVDLSSSSILNNVNKTVLIVTAHPDDECMFFGPLITSLVSQKSCSVYLLCLTNGNYYGKGRVREQEIIESSVILGISKDKVIIINDSNIQDSPTAQWDEEVLQRHILDTLNKFQVNEVYTFDGYGVSGHINHVAAYHTLRKIYENRTSSQRISSWYFLESVSLWRKYLTLFDLPISFLLGSNVVVSGPRQLLVSQRAMLAHRSQLEWFRYLYIVFSRYMLINSFHRVVFNAQESK